MAKYFHEWNLFFDMTNRKSVSGKILHIQQRDNCTSLCGRDDNYGLPIGFPVATPICPKCLEIKAGQQAEEIERLQAELAKTTYLYNDALKLVHDSKGYERMILDGSDSHAGVVCKSCSGQGTVLQISDFDSDPIIPCPDCNTEATHADSTAEAVE